MRDVRHDINVKEYTITNSQDNYFKEEYFKIDNKEDKRHREDGPAITYKEGGGTYYEWWSNGKLKATFDEKSNKFMKSEDGNFAGLKEANMKEKWQNYVGTLSLGDVDSCSIKDSSLSTQSVLGNLNNIRKNAATTPVMEYKSSKTHTP